jgi:glycerophosphoryl diester phosphodiesterase
MKPAHIASLLQNAAVRLRVAHRGASEQAPENTMAAFQLAAAMGADMIELDVHLTADDQVVVMHDDTVNRTTNGEGAIAMLNWSEIQPLDAGSWKDPNFAGAAVVRLDDVLAWCPKEVFLNIEVKGTPQTKGRLVGIVVQKILDASALPGTMISSFDHELLARARDLHPDITLGAIFYGRLWPTLDLAQRLRLSSLHPHVSTIDAAWVSTAQDAGIAVMAWTVTTKAEVTVCHEAGVRAMIVNDLTLLDPEQSVVS